jgi:predicted site-specific integrase-resolvase
MDKINTTKTMLIPGFVYNSEQVCELFNICKKTLQNFRDRGQISYVKIGRKVIYSFEDLNDLLNKNRVEKC